MSDDLKEMVGQVDAAIKDFRNQYDGQLAELHERLDENEARLNRKGLGGGFTRKSEDSAALNKFVRQGTIQGAMQVSEDPDGGFAVRPTMAQDIFEVMRETNPLRQFARTVTVSSDAYEELQDRATAPGAAWVGETEGRPDTATPQLGKLRVPVRELYAQPKISQKMIDDSSVDIAGYLNRKLGVDFGIREALAFTSGDGVTQPRGFTTYSTSTTADGSRDWDTWEHIATGASAAFPTLSGTPGASDPSALFDAVAALRPQYRARARWFMNRSTWATVRKLRDNEGRFLLQPGLNGENDTLLGFPITTVEDLPDIGAGSLSIWFGDFQAAYTVAERQEMRLLRDPFTAKPNVRLYTTFRVGGDVADFFALKAIKFAAS